MTHPRQLAGSEFASAIDALSQVARRVDPFDFVPQAGFAARIVTLGPFHLRKPEYEGVMRASGASSALLANLMPDGEVGGGPAWLVPSAYPFESLKADAEWDGIGQSVLWDADGSWLVVVSNEGHGIVAGRQAIVDLIEQRLPHRSDELAEIVDRLVVGRQDTADADARVMAMVSRLHGSAEEQQVRDQLGGAGP